MPLTTEISSMAALCAAEARKQAFQEAYEWLNGIYTNREMSTTRVATEMLRAIKTLRDESAFELRSIQSPEGQTAAKNECG